VIGFGTAGRVFHAPLLAALPEFEVTAVVTRDQGRAAEVARLHPGARVVGSVAELDALDLDVVVVASPPALHVEHAAAALRAGRHVVVDKPFAPTAAAAQELLDLAAASPGRLTVFQNRRYDGDFRTVRRLVAEGALGRVLGSSRASSGSSPSTAPAGRAPVRGRASCSTSAPTSSTRRCSCSGRSSSCPPSWPCGARASRRSTTRC